MAKGNGPDAHPGERRPRRDEPTQPETGSSEAMRNKPDHGETSYRGLGRLQDRVALVTGADSGIGRAVALAFAREGAHVMISYLEHHEDAEETLRLVESAGRRGLTMAGDVAEDAVCHRLVEKTVERFGRLDLLVNNAAFQGKAVERFEQIDAERVHRTFRTNIVAMFHLVRHALAALGPGAAIINTASIQAYQPNPGILDYAATKAAIVAFTQGLAKELTPRGIRVNCVAPGPVWTPLIPASFDEEKIRKHGESSPMGRAAQPAELAPAYVFLACDESRYVSGETLGVTGGRTLG